MVVNRSAPETYAARCLIIDADERRGDILVSEIRKGGEFEAMTQPPSEGILHAILCVEPASPSVVKEVAAQYANPWGPVVLVALSGVISRHASPFLREGANDILWLPIRIDELALRLRTWLEKSRAEQEAHRLRKIVDEQKGESKLLGKSSIIKRVQTLIERVAQNDSSVLITGETGTGKEVTARAIHACSARRDMPFVALNLAAIPENLIESELFGHAAGAFTGAKGVRIGQLEAAHGGTLFLDEIGDLSPAVQVKLLRVLQDGCIQRVGENKTRPTEFRLLCATHRDLNERIDSHQFREDLYYRINVVEIELPPLRSRGEDIIFLAQHFLNESSAAAKISVQFSSEVDAALLAHSWPGNVRELKHTMERVVALSVDGDVIGPELIKFRRRRGQDASLTTRIIEKGEGLDNVLADIEQAIIRNTLLRCNGNQTEAAKILKIPRQTLQGRLRKFALNKENVT